MEQQHTSGRLIFKSQIPIQFTNLNHFLISSIGIVTSCNSISKTGIGTSNIGTRTSVWQVVDLNYRFPCKSAPKKNCNLLSGVLGG